jgi:outer membrane receptor protein involved in Fe transport
MREFVAVFVSLFFVQILPAQNPMANRAGGQQMNLTGRFYGKVVEASSNKPIEYASVQLIQNKLDTGTKKRQEVVVAGMLTKTNGDFSLENIPVFGQYILRITGIGLKPIEQKVSFDLKMGTGQDMTAIMAALDKDLGNFKMEIDQQVLGAVTVTASKPGLQLAIDKKVFNVDKNLVSQGGTAVDVMRNVPSLNVDIDGNVTMRNSTPQIFVDGRPTTMTLDQIPADAIESVELITNPSAKYDASGGTAGILNVVMKKNRRVGYNGSVRANVDSRARVGGGGDINIRQNKVNFFSSFNYNQRKSIGNGTTERLTLIDNPNTQLYQKDKTVFLGRMVFFRAGVDYFINNRNTISFSGTMGQGKPRPTTESEILIDSLYDPKVSSFSKRFSNSENEFNFRNAQVSYKYNFPKAGREWTADVTYNSSWNNNRNDLETYFYNVPQYQQTGFFRQRQLGSGRSKNLVLQTDYVNPINDKTKLETGLRMQRRTNNSENAFYIVNNGQQILQPASLVSYESTDYVYAAYATFSKQFKNDVGMQLGLRAESSDYEGRLTKTNEDFKINFPVSLFPSVFLSKKLNETQDMQLNYTRRINRPNFWQLSPFTDSSDFLNRSKGNPGLNPEFTNSVELTYQKTFKNKDNFIASLYYKNTNDLITRYQVVETDPGSGKQVIMNTFINANSSYVTGLELISKNRITKIWELTTNLNLYTSKVNIDDPTQPKQDQFASWFGKINNNIRLPKNFTLQVSGDYQSKTILPPGGSSGGGRGGGFMGMFGQPSASQGYVRANYGVDVALRFEFLKNKQASLSLNVNDIFKTRRQDIHSESSSAIQDIFRRRDPQVARLNFNWRFGKFDATLFKRKNMRSERENQNGMENMNF